MAFIGVIPALVIAALYPRGREQPHESVSAGDP
jgi:hypothetical protein